MLSPSGSTTFSLKGKNISVEYLQNSLKTSETGAGISIDNFTAEPSGFTSVFTSSTNVHDLQLAVLVIPDKEQKIMPQLRLTIDGKEDTARFQQGEGASSWYTYNLTPGKHSVTAVIASRDHNTTWTGMLNVWTVMQQDQKPVIMDVTMKEKISEPIMPPRPFPAGTEIKNVNFGEVKVSK